jgi:hypothetical protein
MSLFTSGETVRTLIVVFFFALELLFCWNRTISDFFDLEAPTLEEYLPLDEDLESAPVATLRPHITYGV